MKRNNNNSLKNERKKEKNEINVKEMFLVSI